MKLHMHKWKLKCWRLVHYPEHEPSRIVTRQECVICGKERDRFTKPKRDSQWEKENQALERFWFGDETHLGGG